MTEPSVGQAAPAGDQPARTGSWLRRQAPWLTAGVAAVALAAAIVGLVLVQRHDDGPAGALSGQEQAAVTAAGTAAANLSSFTRATFDKDYQRALDSTTGNLRSDVQKNEAQIKSVLTQNKFDLSAKVQHAALVGPAAPSTSKTTAYVVLVALNGYRSYAPTTPTPQNLQITVQLVGGKWLANDATQVGVQ